MEALWSACGGGWHRLSLAGANRYPKKFAPAPQEEPGLMKSQQRGF
jgi:hypothetical protein